MSVGWQALFILITMITTAIVIIVRVQIVMLSVYKSCRGSTVYQASHRMPERIKTICRLSVCRHLPPFLLLLITGGI